MTDHPLVHGQTPVEYFKELVESSLSRQRVRAGDLTEFYLVNLLCQYVRLDASPQQTDEGQPLAFRLARALDSGGFEQRVRLRSVGDFSLFMSGFFSDSFARRSVDVDYYRSLGECAYASLSRSEDEAFAEVFGELSQKFVGFMDVLADISDRTTLASSTEVMRIYEKWLRTGSERDGQRLVERGILPNHSIGRRFIQ
jgi:hypothetical protein